MTEVEIYTDGACKYNPGPGGYCGIIVYEGHEKVVSGYEPETTNNRMELTAVIKSLQTLKKQCSVLLTTDSKYVCDSVNLGWMENWKSKKWMKGSASVPNADLWQELDKLLQYHSVKFCWVKGHAGHPYNERCDKTAVEEINAHAGEIEVKKKEHKQVAKFNIYADLSSGCPVKKEVADMIALAMKEYTANPSGIHKPGKQNREKLEDTREKLSDILMCYPDEIVFTSGGTEANNIGIMGLAFGNKDKGTHIICSNAEHSSVYKTCKSLENCGFDVQFIDPDDQGMINGELLKKYIRKDTILVCAMHVNNEFGTINPINELADICHENGILLFSDGVAAFPHLNVNFSQYRVDGYSISGHKFGTPPGIGLLFIRKNCKFTPTVYGGNQEGGKRPGTENIPYIKGLLKAAETRDLEVYEKVSINTDLLISSLKSIKDVKINGSVSSRIPGIVSVSISDVNSEALVLMLSELGIYVSSKSACETDNEDFRVIESIEKDRKYSRGTIRISFFDNLSVSDIVDIGDTVATCVEKLRKIKNS